MRSDLDRRTYLSAVALAGLLSGCTTERSRPTTESRSERAATDPQTRTETATATRSEQSATETRRETETSEATETPTEEPTDTATETDDPTDTTTEERVASSQPKIREVQDNFGNTFTFDGESGGTARVEDEIVVRDGTAVELCVTDVAAAATDDVRYSYWFGGSQQDHPDNTAGDAREETNCWRWEMQRDDYADAWRFSVWIRNGDDIYYQNDSVESDFRVTVYYTNLSLASE